MSAGSLLALEALSIRFPGIAPDARVVDGVDLQLSAGEMLALVGESGGGKTMLGLAICNLLPPGAVRSGAVIWRGRALAAGRDGNAGLLGREMAMVFQDPAASLDPVLTVGDQLLETIRYLQGLGRAEARSHAAALLAEVGLADPGPYLDRYPHQLSGGQRQRVMLALAIAGDPLLLVADEPTTALDPSLRLEILALLETLSRTRRMATLLITHDISLAAAVCDRTLVMQRGRIVDRARTDELLRAPGADHTRELLAALPVNLPPPPPPPSPGEPLLRIEGLTVEYTARSGLLGLGSRRVSPLQPIDLELGAGEAMALVGESGCGKSTLARAASLLIEPASGRIRLSGETLTTDSPGSSRRRIQLIFQDAFASLDPRMRCGEILGEAIDAGSRSGGPGRSETIRELLRRVELPAAVRDRFPHQLSGGQRQRVAIARALAVEPSLIIADEPTSSLDLPTQAGVMALFTRLRTELGVGLLLITHDIELALACCNRIAVMYAGSIVEIFATDAKPAHPYALRLLAAGSRAALSGPGPDPAAMSLLRTPVAGKDDGCPYAVHCRLADADCRNVRPPLLPITKDHLLRCPKVPRIDGTH